MARPQATSDNSRKKKFAINAASGWLSQGSQFVVGFFMLPYAIWRLGENGYGIFQLAGSAIVFFNFLQFGMGPTLVRFYSQAIATQDKEKIQKISTNSQFILCCLGFLGMISIVILSPWFVIFYEIPNDLSRETLGLLICMAISFFFNMIVIVPIGILQGANRYDIVNSIGIIRNLLRASLAIFAFEIIRPSIFLYG